VQTLRLLVHYKSERSQAVSLLLSHGYSWDAEIVLRSIYETTAKIVFICSAEETEQEILIAEFWQGLGAINDQKRARKAELTEKLFKNHDPFSAAVFSLLQNKKLFSLDRSTNRMQRKVLERKWSFSEILETLSNRHLGEWSLKEIKSLLHMYGTASHLIHANQGALNLMIDRVLRDPAERQLLENAHACRIMYDQVSMSFFCAEALRVNLKTAFRQRDGIVSALGRLSALTSPFQKVFAESQTEFYEMHAMDSPESSAWNG